MSNDIYASEVQLPSKGFLYGDKIPDGNVCIVPWSAQEQKVLYSDDNRGGLLEILNVLIAASVKIKDEETGNLKPLPIPPGELLSGDRSYLMIYMRSVSFGSGYQYYATCTDCREKYDGSVDLNELPILYLPDGFSEPFSVKLPRSQATVSLRLLRGKDEIATMNFAKKMRMQLAKVKLQSSSPGDPGYTNRLSRMVVSLLTSDGQTITPTNPLDGQLLIQEFVNHLPALDTIAIENAYQDNDCGVDLFLDLVCPNCRGDQRQVLPLTEEFFRPGSLSRRRGTPQADTGGAG